MFKMLSAIGFFSVLFHCKRNQIAYCKGGVLDYTFFDLEDFGFLWGNVDDQQSSYHFVIVRILCFPYKIHHACPFLFHHSSLYNYSLDPLWNLIQFWLAIAFLHFIVVFVFPFMYN